MAAIDKPAETIDKGALSPHILLVEDNRIALRLLENLIKGAGCEFTSTLDAEDAFNLVKKDKFPIRSVRVMSQTVARWKPYYLSALIY